MRLSGKSFQALRFIAAALCVTFSASDIAWAAPQPAAPTPSTPAYFQAPLQYCQYKESHLADKRGGKTPPMVVLIQDAHANISGQENLAKTLDALMSRYHFSEVFVEGGEGDVSLGALRDVIDRETMKKMAGQFLRDAKISGEEYLNLTSKRPMTLTGVEDINLYAQSLKAYAVLAGKREAILAYLGKSRAAVEKLKKRNYPYALISYEKKSAGTPSAEGLTDLARVYSVDLSSFKELTKFSALRDREKEMDFNLARLELASILEKIGDTEFANFAQSLSGSTQEKGAAQLAYVRGIAAAAAKRGIDLASFSHFQKYSRYLEDFSVIDLDKLIGETSRVEEIIYSRLLESQSSRTLRAVDRYLRLLETAYRIQMTSDEFASFLQNTPDFPTISWQGFLNRAMVEEGIADSLIPLEASLEEGREALQSFYEWVDRRDLAFVDHLEKALSEPGAPAVSALIAGGYHTAHLKKLLKEKGYSYAVIAPIVTQETSQAKYEKVLLEPLQSLGKTSGISTTKKFIAGADQNKVLSAQLRIVPEFLSFASRQVWPPSIVALNQSVSVKTRAFRRAMAATRDRVVAGKAARLAAEAKVDDQPLTIRVEKKVDMSKPGMSLVTVTFIQEGMEGGNLQTFIMRPLAENESGLAHLIAEHLKGRIDLNRRPSGYSSLPVLVNKLSVIGGARLSSDPTESDNPNGLRDPSHEPNPIELSNERQEIVDALNKQDELDDRLPSWELLNGQVKKIDITAARLAETVRASFRIKDEVNLNGSGPYFPQYTFRELNLDTADADTAQFVREIERVAGQGTRPVRLKNPRIIAGVYSKSGSISLIGLSAEMSEIEPARDAGHSGETLETTQIFAFSDFLSEVPNIYKDYVHALVLRTKTYAIVNSYALDTGDFSYDQAKKTVELDLIKKGSAARLASATFSFQGGNPAAVIVGLLKTDEGFQSKSCVKINVASEGGALTVTRITDSRKSVELSVESIAAEIARGLTGAIFNSDMVEGILDNLGYTAARLSHQPFMDRLEQFRLFYNDQEARKPEDVLAHRNSRILGSVFPAIQELRKGPGSYPAVWQTLQVAVDAISEGIESSKLSASREASTLQSQQIGLLEQVRQLELLNQIRADLFDAMRAAEQNRLISLESMESKAQALAASLSARPELSPTGLQQEVARYFRQKGFPASNPLVQYQIIRVRQRIGLPTLRTPIAISPLSTEQVSKKTNPIGSNPTTLKVTVYSLGANGYVRVQDVAAKSSGSLVAPTIISGQKPSHEQLLLYLDNFIRAFNQLDPKTQLTRESALRVVNENKPQAQAAARLAMESVSEDEMFKTVKSFLAPAFIRLNESQKRAAAVTGSPLIEAVRIRFSADPSDPTEYSEFKQVPGEGSTVFTVMRWIKRRLTSATPAFFNVSGEEISLGDGKAEIVVSIAATRADSTIFSKRQFDAFLDSFPTKDEDTAMSRLVDRTKNGVQMFENNAGPSYAMGRYGIEIVRKSSSEIKLIVYYHDERREVVFSPDKVQLSYFKGASRTPSATYRTKLAHSLQGLTYSQRQAVFHVSTEARNFLTENGFYKNLDTFWNIWGILQVSGPLGARLAVHVDLKTAVEEAIASDLEQAFGRLNEHAPSGKPMVQEVRIEVLGGETPRTIRAVKGSVISVSFALKLVKVNLPASTLGYDILVKENPVSGGNVEIVVKIVPTFDARFSEAKFGSFLRSFPVGSSRFVQSYNTKIVGDSLHVYLNPEQVALVGDREFKIENPLPDTFKLTTRYGSLRREVTFTPEGVEFLESEGTGLPRTDEIETALPLVNIQNQGGRVIFTASSEAVDFLVKQGFFFRTDSLFNILEVKRSPGARLAASDDRFIARTDLPQPSQGDLNLDQMTAQEKTALALIVQYRLLSDGQKAAFIVAGTPLQLSVAGSRLSFLKANNTPVGSYEVTSEDLRAAKDFVSANTDQNALVTRTMRKTNDILAAFHAMMAEHKDAAMVGIVLDMSGFTGLSAEELDRDLDGFVKDLFDLGSLALTNHYYFRLEGMESVVLEKIQARPEIAILKAHKALSDEVRVDASGKPVREVQWTSVARLDALSASTETIDPYLPSSSIEARGLPYFKPEVVVTMIGAREIPEAGITDRFAMSYITLLPDSSSDIAAVKDALGRFLKGDVSARTRLAAARLSMKSIWRGTLQQYNKWRAMVASIQSAA